MERKIINLKLKIEMIQIEFFGILHEESPPVKGSYYAHEILYIFVSPLTAIKLIRKDMHHRKHAFFKVFKPYIFTNLHVFSVD